MRRCLCQVVIVLVFSLFMVQSVWSFRVGINNNPTPYYGTIQAAVDAASSGDTIQVSTGTTYEVVIITNKNLEIQGGFLETLAGETAIPTVVDGGAAGSVFTFVSSTSSVALVKMVNGSNFSTGGGGAVILDSEITFESSVIHSNSGSNGGGIYLDTKSHVILTNDTVIFGNTGWWGGGCFVAGRLEADSSEINNNVATDAGGGFYVHTDGVLSICDVDVMHNTASNHLYGGGGIYAHASQVSIFDASFVNANSTAGWGGGLYSDSSTVKLLSLHGIPRIDDNTASAGGGGIYLTNSILEVESAFIEDNTCHAWGGGISAIDSTISMAYDGPNRIQINENNGHYVGGGIYMRGSTVTLQNVSFGIGDGNYAGLHGGAIYAEQSDLTISGGVFENNFLTNGWDNNKGAGIAVFNSNLLLTNSTASSVSFISNKVYSNGLGGAVYIEDDGSHTALLYSVEMQGNFAECGGGIYTTNVNWHAYDLLAISNSASSVGGAVCAIGGSVSFHAGSILKNHTDGSGGGVYTTNATVSLYNVIVAKNSSAGNGGGLAMKEGSLLIDRAAFISNTASNSYGCGGGIWADSLSSCTITHSSAPYYSPTNREPLIFKYNHAGGDGGAVYMHNCATALVEYAQMISNTAHFAAGIYSYQTPLEIQYSLYAHNLGAGHAGGSFSVVGGIYVAYANFLVRFCTMVDNNPYGIYADNATGNINSSIIWGGEEQVTNDTGTLTVENCCVENGYSSWNNFTNNPQLMSDYHLRYDSPCITNGGFGMAFTDIDREQRYYAVGWDQFYDTDNDKLPDYVENGTGVWSNEYQTGTSWNTPDTDGDGMLDGDEWIADVDPNDTNSVFYIMKMWKGTNSNEVCIQQVGGTKAYVTIEMATDLKIANWQPVTAILPPTLLTNNIWFINTATNALQLFRCRASR